MSLLPGAIVAERFVLERLVGRGGMGNVYCAEDLAGGGLVALKIMGRKSSTDRFEREAAALASLDHPGIVRYVAHGRAGDDLWLAMEWLDGEDLERRLGRGHLSPTEVVALASRAADALGAAHAGGVVHRDVKPSNLFLVGGSLERLKVVDFGIAHLSKTIRGPSTGQGRVIGTPAYMAPEQARGDRGIDARADLFSLGCVLFQCLTSRPPFQGVHAMAILAKVLLEDAPRASETVRDVPAALDDLIAVLLAKDPDDRPRDGRDLAVRIAALGSRATLAPRAALGLLEQRLVCVVALAQVLAPSRSTASTIATAPTLADDDAPPEIDAIPATLLAAASIEDPSLLAVRSVADRFGARLERLVDGSALLVHPASGAAADQAAQAARSAIALREVFPSVRMALATGRAISGASRTLGDALDRASALVERAAPGGVRIDDVTAGLVAARFEVAGDAGSLVLVSERGAERAERTLLGRASPFVGRDRELAQLLAAFGVCLADSQPKVIVVTAPPGVGKSRLRFELFRALGDSGRDFQVWAGWGRAATAGSAFGVVAPLLRRVMGLGEGDPLDVRRQKVRACVARAVGSDDAPRVSEFLGELVGTPFPDEESVPLRAARGDAVLLGDQMLRAWEDFVAAEVAARPLLVVLEDVHWADAASMRWIDAALARAAGRPLTVLAFGRPEVAPRLGELWQRHAPLFLPLGELPAEASEALVTAALVDAAPATVAALVQRAGGNAFYLEELVRAVAEGRTERLPDTALAMAQARLETCDAASRRLLRAASVLGGVFAASAVAHLVGSDADAVAPRLSALGAAELLVEAGDHRDDASTEPAWTFRHALLRDAAYAMLTDDDRVLGHRLAGEWLERAGTRDAFVLADHLERGGEPARAAAWFRRAAEQALEGDDFAALQERVQRALACGATGAAAGALRLLSAEGHRWCSESELAAAQATAAMRDLPPASPPWFAAAGEAAGAVGRLARPAELDSIAVALEAAVREVDVSAPVLGALARTAEQLIFLGLPGRAAAIHDALERLVTADVELDPLIRPWILYARADAVMLRDRGAYVDRMTELVDAFDAVGDARNASMQRVNLADALLQVGAHREAEPIARRALDEAVRQRSLRVRVAAQVNLARALVALGRLEEAHRLLRESTERAKRTQDVRRELTCRSYLAEVLLGLGDLDGAEAEARTAVALPGVADVQLPVAQARLVEVLLARGRGADALAESARGIAILERLGDVEEGEALTRLQHARALAACGRNAEARVALADARQRLVARAAQLGPRFRRTFLEGLPEHAATLALAAAWAV